MKRRQAIGKDLLRAQWRWPVGMPLCRPMSRQGVIQKRQQVRQNRNGASRKDVG
jgi:hypothetical protein